MTCQAEMCRMFDFFSHLHKLFKTFILCKISQRIESITLKAVRFTCCCVW